MIWWRVGLMDPAEFLVIASTVSAIGWGTALGHSGASAERRCINHRASLKSALLTVANTKHLRFVMKDNLGSVACEGMLPNMSFEADEMRACAHRALPAAAQLDR